MKIKNLVHLLLAVPAFTIGCTRTPIASVSEESATVPYDAIPGQLIIKLEKPLEEAAAEGLDLSFLGDCTIERSIPDGTRFDARHRESGLHLWYIVKFNSSLPLSKAGQDIETLPGVEHVEYVQRIKPAQISYRFDDPEFSRQWHLYNDGSKNSSIAGADINVIPAWEITTGSPEVIVAVCDGGLDYDHEDLAANMWVNEAEMNGIRGIDDDGNGYVDDIYGYNFVAYTGGMTSTIYADDHGTHVGGTIAAVSNNGTGVSGVAGGDGTEGSGVRLMSIQTTDGELGAYIQRAITYAADNGAVLINCSWGISEDNASINAAIDYFNEYAGMDEDGRQTGPMAGGLAIFAAGNDGTTSAYPAMNDNVYAVASVGANYTKASYSNYGSWVDISAPGGSGMNEIYSTLPDNSYGNMSGTSMACPHVTGVAALVVSRFGGPGFTREQLIGILSGTANDIIYDYNSNYSGRLGAGLVDAYAAVSVEAGTPENVTEFSGTALSNSVTLSWTVPASDDGGVPFGYDIYWSTSPLEGLDPANPGTGVDVYRYNASGSRAGEVLSHTVRDLEFHTGYWFGIASRNVFNEYSTGYATTEVATTGNTAPEITALDGTVLELLSHERGTLRFRLSDKEDDGLTYTVRSATDGSTVYGVNSTISGDVVSVNVNALGMNDGSTYEMLLTVDDGHDTSSMGFTVVIAENHAPKVIGSISNVVLNARNERAAIDLSGVFVDSDSESLTYSSELSTGNRIVNASFSGDNLTLTGNAWGTTTVTITASDGRGESVQASFVVLVRDGSSPVDLYPNPVIDVLNVRTGSDQTADVRISNRAGTVVYTASGVSIQPFSPLQVDMSSLPGGTYYVSIKGNKLDVTMPVAKQ